MIKHVLAIFFVLLLTMGCVQDAAYYPILCEKLSTPLQFSIPECDSIDACEQHVTSTFFPESLTDLPIESTQHIHSFIQELSKGWFYTHALRESLTKLQTHCSNPATAFLDLQASQTNALAVLDALDQASVSLIGFLDSELRDANQNEFERFPQGPSFRYVQLLRANEAGLTDANHFTQTATARLVRYQQTFEPILSQSTHNGISHPNVIDQAHSFWPGLLARASPLSRFQPLLQTVSAFLDSLYQQSNANRLNALLATLDPPSLVSGFEDFMGPTDSVASYLSDLVKESILSRKQTRTRLEEQLLTLQQIQTKVIQQQVHATVSWTPRVESILTKPDAYEQQVSDLNNQTNAWRVSVEQLDQNQSAVFSGSTPIASYAQTLTDTTQEGEQLVADWEQLNTTFPRALKNACHASIQQIQSELEDDSTGVAVIELRYWMQVWNDTQLFSACDQTLTRYDQFKPVYDQQQWWKETWAEAQKKCEQQLTNYVELLSDSLTVSDANLSAFFSTPFSDWNSLARCHVQLHELTVRYHQQPTITQWEEEYVRWKKMNALYQNWVQQHILVPDSVMEEAIPLWEKRMNEWQLDPFKHPVESMWITDLNEHIQTNRRVIQQGFTSFLDWNRGTIQIGANHVNQLGFYLASDWPYDENVLIQTPFKLTAFSNPAGSLVQLNEKQWQFSFSELNQGPVIFSFSLQDSNQFIPTHVDENQRLPDSAFLSNLDFNETTFNQIQQRVEAIDQQQLDLNQWLDTLTQDWEGMTLNALLSVQYVPPFTPSDIQSFRKSSNFSLSTTQQQKWMVLHAFIADHNIEGAIRTFRLIEKNVMSQFEKNKSLFQQLQSNHQAALRDENQLLDQANEVGSFSFNPKAEALANQAKIAHEKQFVFQTIYYAAQSRAARQVASLNNLSIPIEVLPLIGLMIAAYFWFSRQEKKERPKRPLMEKHV